MATIDSRLEARLRFMWVARTTALNKMLFHNQSLRKPGRRKAVDFKALYETFAEA